MTLFIERIEIRQQPEHKRYWAEIEARVEAGFRRKIITTPYVDGRDGMLAALKAYWDELDPQPTLVAHTAAAAILRETHDMLPSDPDERAGLLAGMGAYWEAHDGEVTEESARKLQDALRKVMDFRKANRDVAALVHWEAQGDPSEWPAPGKLSPSEMNDAARELMGERKAEHDAAHNDADLDAPRAEAEAITGPHWAPGHSMGDPDRWQNSVSDTRPVLAFEGATLAVLRAEAEAAGVRVDGRWGEARLRQEIATRESHGEEARKTGGINGRNY